MIVVQTRQGSFFYQKRKIVILPPPCSVGTKVLFGSVVVLCKTDRPSVGLSPPDPDVLGNDRYLLGGWSLF